jgi:hypothetical protein
LTPTAIKISRDNTFMAMATSWKVILDGKEVWKLGNGEESEFLVGAGEHTVKLKAWSFKDSRTYTVRLQEGMVAAFTCRPTLSGGLRLTPTPGTAVVS